MHGIEKRLVYIIRSDADPSRLGSPDKRRKKDRGEPERQVSLITPHFSSL
jgi:hypothetical protein